MPKKEIEEIVHTFSTDQVEQVAQIRTLLNTGSPVEGEYSVGHIVSAALSTLREKLENYGTSGLPAKRRTPKVEWDDSSDDDESSDAFERPRRYYEVNKQFGVFVQLLKDNPQLRLRGKFRGSQLRYLRNASDEDDLMDELILDMPGSKYSLVFRPVLTGRDDRRWLFGERPAGKGMRSILAVGGSLTMIKRKIDRTTSAKWAKVFKAKIKK